MLKYLKKLFGTKSSRVLKELTPILEDINSYALSFKKLSHDNFRLETDKLRNHIKEQLQEISKQQIETRIKANNTEDLESKNKLFDVLDKLDTQYDEKLEKTLNAILPKAFAIVKETARRFFENNSIEVSATDFDKDIANKHKFVKINNDKAIWSNTWKVGGTDITWNMVHYDVQLLGGIILHQGKIAEMATGEGKTLVATLPAFLNALAGKGVHIVTVNDYLAKRDSEWKAPLFNFHGLSVACIDNTIPNSNQRSLAYNADITYGTNNEFGFDYLRDNMVDDISEIVQKKHHFAIIDEVDSVLIDDARTPLIISGPSVLSNEEEFYNLRPRVEKLYLAQKAFVSQLIQDAKKNINSKDKKTSQEGALSLFRTYRGLPKYRPLIKYLSQTGIKQILQSTENIYIQDNSRMMPEADEPLFFTIEEKNNHIELTDKGIQFLTDEDEAEDFFVLPDMGEEIAKIENNTQLDEEQKLQKKEELNINYNKKNERIHVTTQLLKAFALFEKDVDYIVINNQVKIVDEQTGRVLEGRRFSSGLHQAIEAKENVKIQKASQTYATTSLQNYFRMYHKLAGMTGTAETEAGEFLEIYKLDVVVIPTNKPIIRDDMEDKVFKTMKEKFNNIIIEILEMVKNKRPVLVGTTSVEISELLSKMLSLKKINHQVLNAKYHKKEAEIVAEAGKSGTVTIATNMAGRGTDIKLTSESKKAGGLAIIGTERHESRRVDRQLRGRAGRQGDPGSSQFFVSLEDNLMRLFGSEKIASLMDKMGLKEGEVIQHSMVTKSIERAQKKVEENNFSHRKRLLEYDDVMNIQREVIYKRRKHALFGDKVSLDIMNMFFEIASYFSNLKNTFDFKNFKIDLFKHLGHDLKLQKEEYNTLKEEDFNKKLYDEILDTYHEKNEFMKKSINPMLIEINERYDSKIKNISIPITDGIIDLDVNINLDECIKSKGQRFLKQVEKNIILDLIDRFWKEHLQEMDDLRNSVQNAVYEQKDPLIVYKFESFNLFQRFINKINLKTVSYLLKYFIPTPDYNKINSSNFEKSHPKLIESKEELYSILQEENKEIMPQKLEPIKAEKLPGRNERVTVEYEDGTVKQNVKFKSIEEDFLNNKCKII